MTPDEYKEILFGHPSESPEIVGSLPYLIDPPSILASTARWVKFRDSIKSWSAEAMPDDPHLPLFVAQAEKIIAWRATIPPERRIWKAD